MKKKKYLPLYYEWIEQGELPNGHGLCREFVPRRIEDGLDLFWPPSHIDDKYEHTHWGSGDYTNRRPGVFTPLRQNIVLFLAAMNNEL